MDMQPFERYESRVRSTCRGFPAIFERAHGSELFAADGNRYLDFYSGAGVMSYGHHHPALKQALLEYLDAEGIVHGMDMATPAKGEFLQSFHDRILAPRGMNYRLQFPSPGGAGAVEGAFKLARKVTGRSKIVAFTNAYHGMTLGALAASATGKARQGAGVPLEHVVHVPFCGYHGEDVDSIGHLERLLSDASSGFDRPAAVILETIQASGGINVAEPEWLRRLEALCRREEMLLIIDDIQVGCGRTGDFFSFEEAGIAPDIVLLSKAISGYGLPMALALLKPEHDVWEPGEHSATFRGLNPAFVTARAALELFWADDDFSQTVKRKGEQLTAGLQHIIDAHPEALERVKGRGMIRGIEFAQPGVASAAVDAAFARGLLAEASGPKVLKLMPPLTCSEQEIERGLEIVREAVAEALDQQRRS